MRSHDIRVWAAPQIIIKRSERFAMTGISTKRVAKYLAFFLVLAAWTTTVKAEKGTDNRAPDLGECEELQVPSGHKVAFYAYAEGFQVYRWNGTNWIFVHPEAVLYAGAQSNGVVGTHYVGPTWETNSGSYVVGAVLERCNANSDSIPWLLLGAVDSDGPGPLEGVTFIQRINTVGGLAPTHPGEFVGAIERVPYTADYFFYRKHK